MTRKLQVLPHCGINIAGDSYPNNIWFDFEKWILTDLYNLSMYHKGKIWGDKAHLAFDPQYGSKRVVKLLDWIHFHLDKVPNVILKSIMSVSIQLLALVMYCKMTSEHRNCKSQPRIECHHLSLEIVSKRISPWNASALWYQAAL